MIKAQLQNTSAIESSSKFASGKAMNVTFSQSFEDGPKLMESFIQQPQNYHQLHLTSWKSYIVIAQQTATQLDALARSMEWNAHWHLAIAMDRVPWMQTQW